MSQPTETAILAGGCFWGMQDLIRQHLASRGFSKRYHGLLSTQPSGQYSIQYT